MSLNIPDVLRYHRDHLWLKAEATDCEVILGITDFAQKQLGNIVFVDLPRVGQQIEVGAPFGTVESHKVVSDLIAPVSGEVLAFNTALKGGANLINSDCYGTGWLMRLRVENPACLAELMSPIDYRAYVGA
jgi:glycine cleavage system H protein